MPPVAASDGHLVVPLILTLDWVSAATALLLEALLLPFAGLGWREIALLRALTRYLRQIGLTYTLDYAASTLVRNPGLAGRLVELFHARNDPDKAEGVRTATEAELLPQIEAELVAILRTGRV